MVTVPRILAAATLALLATAATAQQEPTEPMQNEAMNVLDQMRDRIRAAREQPAGDDESVPSIDLGRRSQPIEPQQTDIEPVPGRVGLPAAQVDLDPSVLGVAPGQKPPALLREGQFIVHRIGRLVERSGVLLMVFDPRPGQQQPDPPMVLQACTTLEVVEELVARRGADLRLMVSGQVHAYRGFNYLLPTLMEPAGAMALEPPSEPPPTAIAAATEPPSETAEEEPADAPEPSGEAEDAAAPADDVMAQLMELRPADEAASEAAATGDADPLDPTRPLIEALDDLVPPTMTVQIDRQMLGIAPDAPLPALRREGEFIVSRRGRLVRSAEGRAMLFVFESDSAAAPELPLIVQPCRLRESMEDIVTNRGDNVVFIVSGQVHLYHGGQYLLPTMMKLAVDRGNLLN